MIMLANRILMFAEKMAFWEEGVLQTIKKDRPLAKPVFD
jgi:hypothetical protein